MIFGSFPDAVLNRDVSRSLAIVTRLAMPTLNELFTAVVKGFARYSAVIFNIDRFVVRRENGQEREALLERNSKPME